MPKKLFTAPTPSEDVLIEVFMFLCKSKTLKIKFNVLISRLRRCGRVITGPRRRKKCSHTGELIRNEKNYQTPATLDQRPLGEF